MRIVAQEPVPARLADQYARALGSGDYVVRPMEVVNNGDQPEHAFAGFEPLLDCRPEPEPKLTRAQALRRLLLRRR